MSRHFLQYLKPKQAKLDLSSGTPLNHTAGGELYRVKPHDTIWWVTARPDGELILLGKLDVWRCTDQQGAEKILGRKDLYRAAHHVLAEPGTGNELQQIPLTDVAPLLRFVSRGRNRLNIVRGRVNPQELQKMRQLTPEAADLLEQKLSQEQALARETENRLRILGAGFGVDLEKNRQVEKAAIRTATRWYESRGWSVESVEAAKCGFDLQCKKRSEQVNVEVKGVRGSDPSFIITAAEERRSRCDPRFLLCVVTNALDEIPKTHFYSCPDLLKSFELEPLAYRVRRRL